MFHALVIVRCSFFVSPSLYPSVSASNERCEQVVTIWSYRSLGISPIFIYIAVVVFMVLV